MDLISTILQKIKLIVGRAAVTSVTPPSGDQGYSVDVAMAANERRTGIPMIQHYGVASVPKSGSEIVVLFQGGSRDNGIAIASAGDPSKLPKLEPGEVAIYAESGQVVHLLADGSIMLKTASGKPVRVEADLNVTGKVLAVGEVATRCVDADGVFTDAAAVHLGTHMHPTAAVGPASPPTPGT